MSKSLRDCGSDPRPLTFSLPVSGQLTAETYSRAGSASKKNGLDAYKGAGIVRSWSESHTIRNCLIKQRDLLVRTCDKERERNTIKNARHVQQASEAQAVKSTIGLIIRTVLEHVCRE